jgi:hypothetical protein
VCLYIAAGLVILHSRPGHLVGRLCLVGGFIQSVGGGLLELSHLRLKEHPADPLAALARRSGPSSGQTGVYFSSWCSR